MDKSRKTLLDNLAIVLKHPKYSENIGAAARSAANMGINCLITVPGRPPDREKMLQMATHKAAHVIEGMASHIGLPEALAPFQLVVGTTARVGRHRQTQMAPREMAAEIMPLLAENRVALLFGPEDRGLTNDDLKYCNLLTTIPTAAFSSLNLAQAVAILCYEVYLAALQAGQAPKRVPRLADFREMEGMYEHLDLVLKKVGFVKTPDSEYWMTNIRKFLGRVGLRAKEVRIIRGVCRQFLWHEGEKQHRV